VSVYNDMANDAGYSYGSLENQQLAEQIEYDEMHRAQMNDYYEEEMNRDVFQ